MEIAQNKYFNHDELTDILMNLSHKYPDLMEVNTVGMSVEGRDIWAVTLTDTSNGTHDSKPALFIDACTHAGEVTGTQTCLYLIDYLLSNFGKDEEVTRALKKRTIYVIPRINPDGAERFLMTSFESWGNLNPFPEKDDWIGLERCDIDNNGLQLLMRIKDKNGEWKISSKDERLMIPRKSYEYNGEFYRIYPEGRLVGEQVNWDDFKVLPKEYQLNMNRNYPDGWSIKTSKLEGGKYPFSEPEVYAVANFMMSHPNIGMGNDFHTYGGVLLRPYSYQADTHFPAEDLTLFNAIGEVGKEITGYDLVSAYEGFSIGVSEPRRGCIDDWAYECLGILMITTELWNMAEIAGVNRNPGNYYPHQVKSEDDEIVMLKWNDTELQGSGFIPWTKFDHPELGELEIGGWNWKFTSKNPPIKFLEEECRKNAIHCLKQVNMLPEIEVKKHNIEMIGKDLYKVSITIENIGYLPTYITSKAINNKLDKEIEITLVGNDIEFINCRKTQSLGHLPGRFRRESNFYFGEPTEGVQKKTNTAVWVIRTQDIDTVTININSQKAGCLYHTIKF